MKFEESIESGIHAHLSILVGEWSGTTKTWFEPDVIGDESPMTGSVTNALGLATPESRGVEYAGGRKEVVPVTEGIVIKIGNRRTNDEALVLGDEVLIGQTILEKLDLHVDCANQVVIPNPAHPDQATTKVK